MSVPAGYRRPLNPLGVAGLVAGAVAFVLAEAVVPLQVLVQMRGGSAIAPSVVTALEAMFALAATVLGVVGLVRRRHSPASAAAAVAVGIFFLIMLLTQLVATVAISL